MAAYLRDVGNCVSEKEEADKWVYGFEPHLNGVIHDELKRTFVVILLLEAFSRSS